MPNKILVKRGTEYLEFEDESKYQKTEGDLRLFTQDDFNALDQKLTAKYDGKASEWKTKYDSVNTELTTLRQDIQSKQETENTRMQSVIAEAKKGLSARDLKTLEMFERSSIQDAYNWLNDPEIVKEGRKTTPKTPSGKEDGDGGGKSKLDFGKIL